MRTGSSWYLRARALRKRHTASLPRGWRIRPCSASTARDELRRLINMCDLYVHASDAEIEGISCMEALACGLVPVISVRRFPPPASSRCARRACSVRATRMILRAGSITGWSIRRKKRAYAEQYALRQDENRVEACVARAERCTPRRSGDKRRKGYRRCPSAAGGAAKPSCEAIRRNFCQGGTVRTLLFWLFTTLLSPILWLLDRLLAGAPGSKAGENLDAVQGGAVSIMNHVHPLDCTMAKVALFPGCGLSVWRPTCKSHLQAGSSASAEACRCRMISTEWRRWSAAWKRVSAAALSCILPGGHAGAVP